VSTAVTLNAHAKVNLILRVLAREPSGYHQIETVFQRLALADTVAVRATDGARTLDVAFDGITPADLGATEKNLAWRAAAAFCDASGWRTGWTIELTKRIPSGAGLGGGSSDAAAVLRALEQLAPQKLGAAKLHELAASLGADVAFFVSDASLAIGRGRGDKLRALRALPSARVTIAVPGFPISTADAYASLDTARTGEPTPAAQINDGDDFGTWASIAERQVNDFEVPAFKRFPELAKIRGHFEKSGALFSRLSGSGSTVFALWPEGTPPGESTKASINTETK
jgi:4-diphosphocytidyl-2-C-methyl-D-erythritol kinase